MALNPFSPLRNFLRPLAVLGLIAAGALTACDPVAAPPATRDNGDVRQPDTSASNNGLPNAGGSMRQRQAEFLNRIRQSDPQSKTIARAVLNAQNELGLILDRSVPLDAIPALMRTILTQMAKEFPAEDLTVIAYAPSTPPQKIGTARFDSRTREMQYSPEHP